MAKKNADRITEILHDMDRNDLLNVIRIIQKDIGDRATLKAIEQVTSSKSEFDPDEIIDMASGCADMNEDEWYSVPDHDVCGRYLYPEERAANIINDNVKDMFENDLKQIVSTGNLEKASEFLCAVAEGLRQASGILAEGNEDFLNDFARHLEECAEKKDFEDAFDW